MNAWQPETGLKTYDKRHIERIETWLGSFPIFHNPFFRALDEISTSVSISGSILHFIIYVDSQKDFE